MISFGDCIVQHTTQNMHIFSDLSQHVQFFMSVVCLLACAYIHEVVHVCMFSVTWHRSSNWEMSLALGGERVLSGSRVWTSSKRHATSAWFASFSFIWAWSNKPSTLLTYTHTRRESIIYGLNVSPGQPNKTTRRWSSSCFQKFVNRQRNPYII